MGDQTIYLLDMNGEPTVPFVAIQQGGGEYDARTYIAGWDAASILHCLAIGPGRWSRRTSRANVEQVDLIAMYRGYTTEVLPVRGSDDVLIVFTPMSDADIPKEV